MAHFWEVIFFVIALIILLKTAFPRFKKMINNYIIAVTRSLEEAENLRKEAQELLQQTRIEWKQSEVHRAEIIALAQDEINTYQEAMRAKTDRIIMSRERQTEDRIRYLEQQASKKFFTDVVNLATVAVMHILSKENVPLTKKQIMSLVHKNNFK